MVYHGTDCRALGCLVAERNMGACTVETMLLFLSRQDGRGGGGTNLGLEGAKVVAKLNNSGLVRRRMAVEVNLAWYGEIFHTPFPAGDKRVSSPRHVFSR